MEIIGGNQMIAIRPSQERGKANFGWLDSKHTFSFGSYYDPHQMGFSHLRVINEDQLQPGKGFGLHWHKDMEIISYVLTGELEHKDSMGNSHVIRSGDVQRMSAGAGIVHSEFNASHIKPVHFLQMWVKPKQIGIKPSYEQKHFSLAQKQGKLKLIASPEGGDNSVKIHQDVNLYIVVLNQGDTVNHISNNNRSVWIQITRGSAQINDQTVQVGDGAAITQETDIALSATADDTEILLFDLA